MLLTVTTTMLSRNTGAPMWFIFLVDEESIAEVYDTLTEKGAIIGDRIDTVRQGSRTVERERCEHIVGLGTVATIRPCHIEFELSDNPVYTDGGEV